MPRKYLIWIFKFFKYLNFSAKNSDFYFGFVLNIARFARISVLKYDFYESTIDFFASGFVAPLH